MNSFGTKDEYIEYLFNSLYKQYTTEDSLNNVHPFVSFSFHLYSLYTVHVALFHPIMNNQRSDYRKDLVFEG